VHVLKSEVPSVHTYSGLPTDVIQIESIEVKPDPPKPGQDLTIIVKAKATDIIEVAHEDILRDDFSYLS
jgi:hypothetical protein